MEYVNYSVDVIGGEAYVKSEMTLTSEPQLHTLWWRITRRTIGSGYIFSSLWEDLIGEELVLSSSGLYGFVLPGKGVNFHVSDEEVDRHEQFNELLPPKGHPKAKWHYYGCWMSTSNRELGRGRVGKIISTTLPH
jgi:hypothetical protein